MVVYYRETKTQRRETMELKGKRIAFLGDSITEGHGLVNTEGAYWNLLKEREGLAEIYVDGIGGTSTKGTPTTWIRFMKR